MGSNWFTGGVVAAPRGRIQFDFTFNGIRYRPSIKRPPSEANLHRARERLEASNINPPRHILLRRGVPRLPFPAQSGLRPATRQPCFLTSQILSPHSWLSVFRD